MEEQSGPLDGDGGGGGGGGGGGKRNGRTNANQTVQVSLHGMVNGQHLHCE